MYIRVPNSVHPRLFRVANVTPSFMEDGMIVHAGHRRAGLGIQECVECSVCQRISSFNLVQTTRLCSKSTSAREAVPRISQGRGDGKTRHPSTPVNNHEPASLPVPYSVDRTWQSVRRTIEDMGDGGGAASASRGRVGMHVPPLLERSPQPRRVPQARRQPTGLLRSLCFVLVPYTCKVSPTLSDGFCANWYSR